MSCIGLCIAIIYIWQKLESVNLTFKALIAFMIVCAVLGFVFARILFVIAMIPSLEQVTINEMMYYLFHGGIVFYGGLFGVILGIVIVSIYMHMNPKCMLDFFAPAFPLFHGFARIGCLLSGCCYGVEWSWGVILEYEPEIIRFPVQLFESICDFIIFFALHLWNRKRNNKDSLALYLLSYAGCRFILEFFRGDEIRGIWEGGLSTAQCVSCLIILIYILKLIFGKMKNNKYIADFPFSQNKESQKTVQPSDSQKGEF